jgi:hypothetical protein
MAGIGNEIGPHLVGTACLGEILESEQEEVPALVPILAKPKKTVLIELSRTQQSTLLRTHSLGPLSRR